MSMFNPGISVILGNVGACSDRYMGEGYSPSFSVEEMFERVASIYGVSGVEMVGNWHITPNNVDTVHTLLKQTNLKLVSIIPDHFGIRKWGKGAFTSKDSSIRRDAIEETKQMMDIAAFLDCDLINLWPGQDGYDYHFQGDYIQERTWFEEALSECAAYRPNMRLSVEYKPKEPRNRSYPSNVYSTLLMVQQTGMNNVGITIDYGHATTAYENVAESVAVLKKYGNKLFHLHMNDNYGFWDDDMIVGSIHTIPYLELFYWLKRTQYTGWISTDQYPYREDGRDAVSESVSWISGFLNLINKLDESELESVIQSGNAVEMSRYMRKLLLGSF